MPQLPSYRRLSTNHQAFVSAYIRNDCDPCKAATSLHPDDPNEVNYRRGWKLMQRDDVKEAIADKLEQLESKHLLSRDSMLKELYALISRANGLPDADKKLSTLKFSKDVLDSMAKVLGYNSSTVNHNEEKSITVQLVGIDDQATKTLDVDAVDVTPKPTGKQLEIDFDPVTWDRSDLDFISEDVPYNVPDPDDDLPDGLGE